MDDCNEYLVSVEYLHELRELCQEVVDKHDAEFSRLKLPPGEGFFFGSNEINQCYYDEVWDTGAQLSRIINWPLVGDADLLYRASW